MVFSLPPVPAYKAQLTQICNANTPSLKVYAQRIVDAQAKNDANAAFLNYRLALQVGLKQNAAVEAKAVPAKAKAKMAPILAKLRAQDPLVRQAVTAAQNGDGATLQALVKKIDALGLAANRLFDAFGLSACGSKQA